MYAINSLAQIPLRALPSDKSEIVSFVLFGEVFTVLENTEKWSLVQLHNDAYQGWLDNKQLIEISDSEYLDIISQAQVLTQSPFSTLRQVSTGTHFGVSMACELPFWDGKTARIGNELFELLDQKVRLPQQISTSLLIADALLFLHTPYLWGGKSIFGIDCSGFTQIVYKMQEIHLLRDASLQITQGKNVLNLEQAQEGDLAFFHNSEGKIIHVGILLSSNKIIHASGCVKIETIDTNGIINNITQQYSHSLHSIRRIL